jgi:Zn-dependent protease with chaperone function
MSTDFFERQDNARRQTFRLLVMFALSVVVIILVIYLLVAAATSGVFSSGRHSAHAAPGSLWDPGLFAVVAIGTTIVVSLGSLYKIAELSAGGEHVALMLGGRHVEPQTQDLAEKRLLNVVEEMALASGVPVPPVFVLENEPGINAFAAGHQPGDAVVAVSRGALEYLTREELQGVLAHEFSHILNGDMKLNIRLIGILNGILVLAIIGYYVMRTAGMMGPSSSSSRDDEKKGDPRAAIFILGLALLILGYLGVFLGKLIKAGISRQREFLADASAVQFTRYPGGIAGALKKIGGLSEGSRIRDAHAEECSHMFFGDAFAGSFFNLLATHPPLAERIKALEPEFDGSFPEVHPLVVASEAGERPSADRRQAALEAIQALPAAVAAQVSALDSGSVLRRIGQPQVARPIAGISQPLADAAREPYSAQAVVYALLLSDEEATQARQWQTLQAQIQPPLVQQTRQFVAQVRGLAADSRLPLVDVAMPALKRFSPQQYAQFRQVVEGLVAADGKVDLFEYCLRLVLFSYLDVHYGLKKPAAVRYRTLAAVAGPAAVVLSSLAYAGQEQREDVQRAFQIGAQGSLDQAALLPPAQCTYQSFDVALTELAQAAPGVKREVIDAMTRCIAADRHMTLKESELLRAVCAALACPMPPV